MSADFFLLIKGVIIYQICIDNPYIKQVEFFYGNFNDLHCMKLHKNYIETNFSYSFFIYSNSKLESDSDTNRSSELVS